MPEKQTWRRDRLMPISARPGDQYGLYGCVFRIQRTVFPILISSPICPSHQMTAEPSGDSAFVTYSIMFFIGLASFGSITPAPWFICIINLKDHSKSTCGQHCLASGKNREFCFCFLPSSERSAIITAGFIPGLVCLRGQTVPPARFTAAFTPAAAKPAERCFTPVGKSVQLTPAGAGSTRFSSRTGRRNAYG